MANFYRLDLRLQLPILAISGLINLLFRNAWNNTHINLGITEYSPHMTSVRMPLTASRFSTSRERLSYKLRLPPSYAVQPVSLSSCDWWSGLSVRLNLLRCTVTTNNDGFPDVASGCSSASSKTGCGNFRAPLRNTTQRPVCFPCQLKIWRKMLQKCIRFIEQSHVIFLRFSMISLKKLLSVFKFPFSVQLPCLGNCCHYNAFLRTPRPYLLVNKVCKTALYKTVTASFPSLLQTYDWVAQEK